MSDDEENDNDAFLWLTYIVINELRIFENYDSYKNIG